MEVRQQPLDPVALATRILTPVLHPLAAAAIIFIVAIFILMQQEANDTPNRSSARE